MMRVLGPTWLCLHPAASKASHCSAPQYTLCKALKPGAMWPESWLFIIHIKWDQRMPKVSPPPGHFSLALGGVLRALAGAICHILSTSKQPQSVYTY